MARADTYPGTDSRNPWVSASELRLIVRDAPSDAGLLDDLSEIRNAELEPPAGGPTGPRRVG